MAKVGNFIEMLQSMDPEEEVSYSLWTREDVKDMEAIIEVTFTDEQRDEVLSRFHDERNEGDVWTQFEALVHDVSIKACKQRVDDAGLSQLAAMRAEAIV